MNVLYVCHDAGLYGASKSLLDLIDALKEYNVTSYIVIPYAGPIEKELIHRRIKYCIIRNYKDFRAVGEGNVIEETLNELKKLPAVKQVIQLVQQWKIDIIHTNNLCTDIGAMAALIKGIPHVWHIREFMEEDFRIEFYNKRKMKYLINKADTIILISKAIYGKHKKLYKKDRMKVIYDLISLEDYNYSNDKFYENETLNLLLCGAISRQKGQIEAVRAVNYLWEQGMKNIRLSIVGRGEKEDVTEIKNYIKRHKLQDAVVINDFNKDLKQHRENSDIALMCSKSEGLGRVTIESMLSEILVIGSNTGATKELIRHGTTGYLYINGDYIDLANQIVYAMEHKEEVGRIKEAAKKFAVNTFTTKALVEEVYKVYKTVLR